MVRGLDEERHIQGTGLCDCIGDMMEALSSEKGKRQEKKND